MRGDRLVPAMGRPGGIERERNQRQTGASFLLSHILPFTDNYFSIKNPVYLFIYLLLTRLLSVNILINSSI